MKIQAHRSVMAEINVTPMVDVMLVLLVIFMVAAPLMEKGISIALPKASTSKQVTNPGISINLTREHLIYLDDKLVTLKELKHELTAASHGQPVLLRADGNATVKRLIELWDLCRETGFREIRIMTLSE